MSTSMEVYEFEDHAESDVYISVDKLEQNNKFTGGLSLYFEVSHNYCDSGEYSLSSTQTRKLYEAMKEYYEVQE